jgi:hypothetical protein
MRRTRAGMRQLPSGTVSLLFSDIWGPRPCSTVSGLLTPERLLGQRESLEDLLKDLTPD